MSIAETSVRAVTVPTAPRSPVPAAELSSKPASRTSACDAARAQSRQLALLKRAGLFQENLDGVIVHRASTADELSSAYRLVYEVYRQAGYINPDPSGMRLRMFETSSDTATFIAKVNGRVIGVISVVGDSADLGLPSDIAFSDELNGLREKGVPLCEVTNQAVAEDYRKSGVTTELMRCAVAHSIAAGYRMGIATVSPSHCGFYDLLGFQLLGEERSYSDKIYDPVVALAVDFENYCTPPPGLSEAGYYVHQFLGSGNPYRRRVAHWDRRARLRFLNAHLLERLFVIESNFLVRCSALELEIIRLRWGQELFNVVARSAAAFFNKAAAFAVLAACTGQRYLTSAISAPPAMVVSRPLAYAVRRYQHSRDMAKN